MFISKQLTVAIDFHRIFSMVWKSVATIDSLVNNSFQNILFCVQQKKEICPGLEQGWVWQNVQFWVNYPFKDIIKIVHMVFFKSFEAMWGIDLSQSSSTFNLWQEWKQGCEG